MLTLADFHLGRMAFPTSETEFKELVGDPLEAVGAGLSAGERRPRAFELALPVRASDRELNPYLDGARMRRQVRSMMDNTQLRLGGLYMNVAFDPELNGWLLIGGGQLEYNEGGITFNDFKLSLQDAYVAGQRRLVRPARRIEAVDRRLSTTPRDYEGLIYSTAFAATANKPLLYLPSGVEDIRRRNTADATASVTQATADGGTVQGIGSMLTGDVYHFEQAEAQENLGDVVIYDRKGILAPAELMTVKEPQATFGWEEVYGPNYPLSGGDAPVLSNGRCRVRWNPTAGKPCFSLDQFSGGAWVERQRIGINGGAIGNAYWIKTILSAQVKEWTPDRAVIKVNLLSERAGMFMPFDVYITLERGWTGPRFEVYSRPQTNQEKAIIVISPAVNEEMLLTNSGTAGSTGIAGGLGVKRSGDEGWTYSALWGEDPYLDILPVAVGFPSLTLAAMDRFEYGLTTNTTLWGAERKGIIIFGSTVAGEKVGYAGVDIRLGESANHRNVEAEAYRNAGSGTATQVALAEGHGGQVVQDTQAAATAPTLIDTATDGIMGGNPGLGTRPAKLAVWVKARVVTAGATASLKAKYGANETAVVTTTSTALTWVYLGLLTRPQAAKLEVFGWRSAGAGNIYIDQIALINHESNDLEGAGDVSKASLVGTRGYSELVAR